MFVQITLSVIIAAYLTSLFLVPALLDCESSWDVGCHQPSFNGHRLVIFLASGGAVDVAAGAGVN